ncbi:hypothetical protein ACOSQ3_014384 [Xanthoceras sorbifolium]
MLKFEDNNAEMRVLHDELVKTEQRLAVAGSREKELTAELEKLRARKRALKMELKESATALNEKKANAERAHGEVAQVQGQMEKLKKDLARSNKEFSRRERC